MTADSEARPVQGLRTPPPPIDRFSEYISARKITVLELGVIQLLFVIVSCAISFRERLAAFHDASLLSATADLALVPALHYVALTAVWMALLAPLSLLLRGRAEWHALAVSVILANSVFAVSSLANALILAVRGPEAITGLSSLSALPSLAMFTQDPDLARHLVQFNVATIVFFVYLAHTTSRILGVSRRMCGAYVLVAGAAFLSLLAR